MVGGEGRFTPRCAGGAYDNTIVNRIMLRFRPIAPKPAIDGSVAGGLQPENNSELIPKERTKRKYVKVNRRKKHKKHEVEERKDGFDGRVATLQLLPEMSGQQDTPEIRSAQNLDFMLTKSVQQLPTWMNFNKKVVCSGDTPDRSDQTVVTQMQPTRVVESWVMLECLTDTCMDGGGLGSTDAEKVKNLEVDACPGFISDGFHKVQWVNLAYRKLVGSQDDGEQPSEVVVWLLVKEKFPVPYPSFACRVRLVYTRQKHSQTMPCDVWRMDFGGFAWRLDVKAALRLGR